MPRRRPPDPPPTPAEIDRAFAANLLWLMSLGDVLPRHLIFVGLAVSGIPYAELLSRLKRWEDVLDPIDGGDYHATPQARARAESVIGADSPARELCRAVGLGTVQDLAGGSLE